MYIRKGVKYNKSGGEFKEDITQRSLNQLIFFCPSLQKPDILVRRRYFKTEKDDFLHLTRGQSGFHRLSCFKPKIVKFSIMLRFAVSIQ